MLPRGAVGDSWPGEVASGDTMSPVGIYRALDTTVELTAPAAGAAALRSSFADLAASLEVPAEHRLVLSRRWPARWSTRLDGVDRVSGRAPAALVDISRAVNEVAAESVAATHTVLTASAVDFSGRAVVFVGPRHSGKSTLTAAAALSGRRYLADEVVAIDPAGTVRPFHRPTRLRAIEAERLGVAAPVGDDDVVSLRLGDLVPLSPGAPVSLIVVLARHADATVVLPLEPAALLVQLANQAVRFHGSERIMFRRFEALVNKVPAILLMHHNRSEALAHVERALAKA